MTAKCSKGGLKGSRFSVKLEGARAAGESLALARALADTALMHRREADMMADDDVTEPRNRSCFYRQESDLKKKGHC